MTDTHSTEMDKPSSDKQSLSLYLVILVLVASYLWSLPRSILLEDDGYFVLAAYFNGVAHPPGYPLYTLLGHWFTLLPIDSVAFRVHLLSAIFAISTCVVLWKLVLGLLGSTVLSAVAALAFGLSSIFWSQAIIAEVYTLNTFLFLALLLLAFNMRVSCNQARVFLFMLLYGLALSNHWPLIILSSPALAILLWPHLRQFFSLTAIMGLLVGLLPYVWMVVNSRSDTLITFYGPIASLSDFWFYFSREAYAQQDVSASAGFSDKFLFLKFVLQQSLMQFGYTGVFLAVIGFITQWQLIGKVKSASLVACYLGSSLLLILLLDFDFDVWHQNIFRVYPLISYAVYVIWMVTGMHFLLARLKQKQRHISRLLLPGFIALIAVSILPVSLQANLRADDTWSIDYAREVLDRLDRNAVLFTYGDLDQGALAYLNLVLKYRPDVELYSTKGVLLSNRLFYPMRHGQEHINQTINNFIRTDGRPVYFTYGLEHDFMTIDYGIVKKIVSKPEVQKDSAVLDQRSISHINHLLNQDVSDDPWKLMHYKLLFNDYCRIFLKIHQGQQQSSESSSTEHEATQQVCSLYPGKLEQIEALLNTNSVDTGKLATLIEQAEKLQHQSVMKADNARLEYYRGHYYGLVGNDKAAQESFEQSLQIWNHPRNPARKKLLQ